MADAISTLQKIENYSIYITTAEPLGYSGNGSQHGTVPTMMPNLTASTSREEMLLPFDDVTVTIVAIILLFFLVFGFVGNLLTLLVIVTSRKLRNVFNLFILSLCVSDLISSLISWINLYRRTWGFNVFALPDFFCVLYWGADIWTSYVTAQHIMSFAILRLLSVWKPVLFSKIKSWHANVWIASIWFIAFLSGFIPFALFSGARIRDRSDRSSPVSRWPACTQNEEWLPQYSLYTQYGYPIFFYVPLVAIALVSSAIGVVMVRRTAPQSKHGNDTRDQKTVKRKQKEKQAIMQLALIVGSFMFGYIPFTVFEFYTINSTDKSFRGWKIDWTFGTAQYMCLRLSECLNPIFYNLASTKMRRETKSFLKRFKCNIVDSTSNSSSRASSHSHTGLEL
ncbi:growth hormone secretagogue receptor type 1-like [Styela clava]